MFGELYFQMSLRYVLVNIGLDTEEEIPYWILVKYIRLLENWQKQSWGKPLWVVSLLRFAACPVYPVLSNATGRQKLIGRLDWNS